jgi:hypothetical protein
LALVELAAWAVVLRQVITQRKALVLYLMLSLLLVVDLGLVTTQLPQQVVAHQVAELVVVVVVVVVRLQQTQVALEIPHLHLRLKEIMLAHLLMTAVLAAAVQVRLVVTQRPQAAVMAALELPHQYQAQA